MLSFRVHGLEIGQRHYLLLPKMTPKQMRLLAGRLEGAGYSVRQGDSLSARSRESTIHVAPSGICWSTTDPSDAILPAIPDILTCEKERVPVRDLESIYLTRRRLGAGSLVRISTRIESASLWDSLRASDGCGLAPDEHAVASSLIKKSAGDCEVLTDFPADDSVPMICGRKRYYHSRLGCTLAAETLRSVRAKGPRNSYLFRSGVLKLGRLERLDLDWFELSEELGDWCSFAPA